MVAQFVNINCSAFAGESLKYILTYLLINPDSGIPNKVTNTLEPQIVQQLDWLDSLE